jgi:transcriptional regulator with XRE-family HTH domain
MKTFTEQLREAIEKSGESQYAIAKATGINQGNLSKFLSGERGMSLDNIDLLCDYLKLKLVSR